MLYRELLLLEDYTNNLKNIKVINSNPTIKEIFISNNFINGVKFLVDKNKSDDIIFYEIDDEHPEYTLYSIPNNFWKYCDIMIIHFHEGMEILFDSKI